MRKRAGIVTFLFLLFTGLLASGLMVCAAAGTRDFSYSYPQVELSETEFTYNGEEIKPEVSVSFDLDYGWVELTEGLDYELLFDDCVNAGKKTITIRGKGQYTGEAKAFYRIEPLDLSDKEFRDNMTCSIPDLVYTGSALEPQIAISFKGKPLQVGKDFSIDGYENRTGASQSTYVTIKGMGNFYSHADLYYRILKADISNAAIEPIPDCVYFYGDEQCPQPKLTYMGKAVPSDQYNVEYLNNRRVGTATMIITGGDNFTGTKTVTFQIVSKDKAPRPVLRSLRAGKRSITVNWKEVKSPGGFMVTGYQVQYSTDKHFKKQIKTKKVNRQITTSVVLTRLKPGKRYYVRVRSVMNDGTMTLYSSWSKVKNKKV